MDRAAKQKPGLELDSSNASTIARICRRLDGIPLALELAAARLRSLSPSELDTRLDDRFGVLKGTARDTFPRQQTLRALIDWSWNLLTAPEQSVLARLSVFPASFELDAAEAVAANEQAEEADVCDLLTSLVDKSLVHGDDTEEATRYRLLETVREYASAKLTDADARAEARRAHLEHYLELAESAKPRLHSRDATTWLGRLDREHDNLRAAMERSRRDPDPTLGMRLVVALDRFWGKRGFAAEVVEAATDLLDRADAQEPTLARAGALNAVACLAPGWLGEHALGQQRGGEALVLARSLHDDQAACEAFWNIAWVHALRGEDRAAFARLEEAFTLVERLGNPELHAHLLRLRAGVFTNLGDWEPGRADYEYALRLREQLGDLGGVGEVEGDLGNLAMQRRDLATARSHLDRAIAISRQFGDEDTWLISTLNVGVIEYVEGSSARARSAFHESLSTAHRHRNQLIVGCSLFGLALSATDPADLGVAAVIHGAAAGMVAHLGQQFDRIEAELRDADYLRLREAMGQEAFEQAYDRGQRMQPDEAIALADALIEDKPNPGRAAAEGPKLSKREQELLMLVADGLTDAQIAERLCISVKTVHSHLDRIRDKTGARRRPELTQYALALAAANARSS
jgi:DNA-binding CsgD family transcriptional regulator